MNIAVVTDDGSRVAMHFGRARFYQVFSVEDGEILRSELRDRRGTLHHGHDHGHGHDEGRGDAHGFGAGAADRHAAMLTQLSDVSVLLVGGMGRGARQAVDAAGIAVVATDIGDTTEAVTAYLSGRLENREQLFH